MTSSNELASYPKLVSFVENQIGPTQRADYKGWEHGESLVWECHIENSEQTGAVYLKAHRQPRKFQQELNAYRKWLPVVASKVPNVRTPALIADQQDPFALLMSCVPGVVLSTAKRSPQQMLNAYESAGTFLRQLHSIPYHDDDIPLSDAFEMRMRAWLERAAPHVAADDVRWVEQEFSIALPLLEAHKRVPCHRDFSPRNWLIDDRDQLSIIDFEHSRADLLFQDVERMWSREWVADPQFAEAFWSGYGRQLTDEEQFLLQRFSALSALSTIAWATEHNDVEFEKHGRQVLMRLRSMTT